MMNKKKSKATAVAGSNIAFIKYWGNYDDNLRIPMNGSISMTLDNATTKTSVEFSSAFKSDKLILNNKPANNAAINRVSKHLDFIRKIAKTKMKAEIVSKNSFPTGAGIASSASGFAALTVAACGALNLNMTNNELSRIARLGSGSACRSIDGGFVEWFPGGRHEDSFAAPFASSNHWDLIDIIAIVSDEHKSVGSSAGHPLSTTSPFYQARLGSLQSSLQQVRNAILDKEFAKLGELIEAEAISLHVAAMTSTPSILYWQAGSLNIIHALRKWRSENSNAVGYFTMDAGPNVHIISERKYLPELLERLKTVDGIKNLLICGVGKDAYLIE